MAASPTIVQAAGIYWHILKSTGSLTYRFVIGREITWLICITCSV